MSTETRLAALENLLSRVRTRSGERSTGGAVALSAAAPAAVAPGLELDEAFVGVAKPSFDDPPALPRPAESAPVEDFALDAPSSDFEEIEDLDDVEEVSDDLDLDEAPPESHSSPVATSMEQALASAAAAPPLTPPPESGPEPAHSVHASHPGPTMEQLGETISLEEGPDRAFELDEPLVEAEEPAATSSDRHLEADLPGSSVAELHEPASPPAPVGARVTARPQLSTNVVDFVAKPRSFEPQSFIQLLDSSLAL